jgi:hypothetical protein
MFFSRETLSILLTSRHELYVQLGLVNGFVATVRERLRLGLPSVDAAIMYDLIDGLEAQIGEINRRIAQFKGPVPDETPDEVPGEAMLAAAPV